MGIDTFWIKKKSIWGVLEPKNCLPWAIIFMVDPEVALQKKNFVKLPRGSHSPLTSSQAVSGTSMFSKTP